MKLLLWCALFVHIAMVAARSWNPKHQRFDDMLLETQGFRPRLSPYRRDRRDYTDRMVCKNIETDIVRDLMELICSTCHELQSHFEPDTRPKCREDCFNNNTFRRCLKLFTAVPSREYRNDPFAPVLLYSTKSEYVNRK
ncbi:unnamed protein product [Caenorhabditis bovis]|uniref:Uncharacterized protein n=1 Tax=Caenorhabditis bovis TaxID=2654633 RepID=A0A8S1EIF7_9PELO|nr:unnamed protein product [Caenorhabditis bovis]